MPSGPYGSPILDTMVRADESPLSDGGNWPDRINSGSNAGDPQIISNVCTSATTFGTRHWLTNFPGDVEAGFKISSKAAGNYQFGIIYTRLNDVATATPDGYQLIITPLAGTDVLQLYRMDNGGHTQLGGDVSQELTAGDALALASIGSDHSIWYHNGTSWSSLLTETDATYTSGYTGIESSSTNFAVVDWFAGAIGGGGLAWITA